MARGLNKVMLIGRLGADPEIRYTSSGTAVANLRIATDSPVKRGDQWETVTEWHRVVAWNRLAEICGEYLGKGRLVYVEGRLQTRSWEDQDGNKRWSTEIVARDIQILDSRSGRGEGAAGGDELGPPPPPEEDDVPF
ncbi:single-stranded DNA-binding protein [Dissulfurirhabdus thermomarina]|uniref:Single-stranded DNA-binding protein n=1 Tax=Dissulfurirhabdus thermomarina TaxID=1765737 RepID=A0A6N9TLQ1_DISTH|nr:single-stranded DNA-binding protein [Dissulfurirhabdus thermomarina]NDY42049.1 single-stranded DNA-binding protein [Dissulfurirhabdus thermomarina]NMX22341.1 single-stranded DNA-binding protein [Dissulfurirhabdus thermomarina]